MNAACNERAAGPGSAREHGNPGTPDEDATEQFASAYTAVIGLATALRHLADAWCKLAATEGRVALAAIPLLFPIAIALVAFSVSLWACLIALVGWLLVLATHSLGIALGLLVILHIPLVLGARAMFDHSLRQMTFPQTRAELRLLGCSVLDEADRFAGSMQTATDKAAGQGSSPECET